ncbi:hypothetical protein B296_00055561 [Ensete ventricosum]|uniref:Uncharacterized protein n=1 Tax=Ensete ventricosum TaxID=4639 RepID=A0A426XZN1_ENSVE|nr:hypothetical protein B296_00055561 [Ensete ventricosum]
MVTSAEGSTAIDGEGDGSDNRGSTAVDGEEDGSGNNRGGERTMVAGSYDCGRGLESAIVGSRGSGDAGTEMAMRYRYDRGWQHRNTRTEMAARDHYGRGW